MRIIKTLKERLELKYMIFVMALLVVGILWSGILSFFVRNNLYSTAEENLDATATIVAIDITRTMHESVDKKAELSRQIVEGLKTVKGIEDIKIINAQGKEAFKKESGAIEAPAMKNMSAKQTPLSYKSEKSLIFYKPLENASYCRGCHPQEGTILGAVKVVVSLEKIYGKSMNFILWTTIISMIGISAGTFFFWIILRKLVIKPISSIEKAATSLADGDLSYKLDIKTEDEIGRLNKAINVSVRSLGRILQRVKNGSKRAFDVAEKVEHDFKKLSEGTKLESEAIANIATSIEQMNSAAAEISDSTERLANSTEETAASTEEMVTSISQVANSAQELSTTVDSTSSSIEELSATIKEVATRAEELSAVSEETLAASEEIYSSIKEVEQSAKESAMFSEKVKTEASTFGIASVDKTIQGMQDIKASVGTTASFVAKLGVRSNEIGKILNVIDEITDQTTLLALNAAILAAQAGEHGKGFSVVADEIKDLAERTSFSTREIAELIQTIQEEVKDAIRAMDEGLRSVEDGFKVARDAGDALKKIVESSKQSAEMSFAIERSTAEQARATRLVSEAMEKVKNMVAMVAMATSEQSKGALLITTATEKMKDVANHVKAATGEQLMNIKQVSTATELVSEKSQHIATAINELKSGSNQIFRSIEKIKDIPKTNINILFDITRSLKGLFRNTELVTKEMERMRLSEETLVTPVAAEVIRFGIEPIGVSPVEMVKKFSLLAEYLGKKIGKTVELRAVSDYEGAIRDIGHGITQVCFMAPTTYLEASKKYEIEVLVKALTEGKSSYRSVIIAKSDSKISSIEDIKGHTFAFGDPRSLSNYIAPRIMLLDAGIDLKDLLFYEYLGPHEEVINAVLKGNFDAGGVTESIAYMFKDKGIKFIKFSEDLPGFCISVSKTLPERDKNSLKDALTVLTDATPEGSSILHAIYKRYTAFEEASDADYANVGVMMSKLGML
ncbi:MAG: phosphate/phosphite/phosphonate ABC transporter substrate-binding protein [Nitrospirota bacterium]